MVSKKGNRAIVGCSLDVSDIIKFFGGQKQMVRDLAKAGIVEISTSAIDKWQSRNQIPGARLMDLQSLAELQGKQFNISTYIRRPVKAVPPKAVGKKKAA
jgi:hypothetical protein